MKLSDISFHTRLKWKPTVILGSIQTGALVLKSLLANLKPSLYTEGKLPVRLSLLAYVYLKLIALAAYDLKLLIDKGIYDILKPDWVADSIALGHPAPFRKRQTLPPIFTSFS